LTDAGQRTPPSVAPWLPYLGIAGILVLAAGVRLFMLGTAPGWYPDEGSDIEIATRLLQGEQRYFAVGGSTLVTTRLPLFHLVLAGLFSVVGRGILTLRLLTVGYVVLITLLLFVLGRRMWGSGLALVAAAVYAVYPNAVLYSRFGFVYNQLALLNLLTFYALWRFTTGDSRWWLAGACAAAGLALVTGIAALPIAGFVVITLLLTRRSALAWAVPLLACLPAAYFTLMVLQAPQAFFQDLHYLMSERVGGGPLMRAFLAVWNYKQLLLWDAWIPLGAFGLTRLKPGPAWLYTQVYFWYSLFMTAAGTPALGGVGYHYAIPLFPWLAVGIAAFVAWAFPRLATILERLCVSLCDRLRVRRGATMPCLGQRLVVGVVLFWLLLSPFAATAVQLRFRPGSASPYPSLEMERVTVQDYQGLERLMSYLKREVTPNDVVLAPPGVAWMVEANVADFQQTTAYAGGETQNYPRGMDRSRFVFDCSLSAADYALWWRGWREWEGGKMPDVEAAYRAVEQWSLAFQSGEWRLYTKPRHAE
jgi:hypothetical protein